jgi:hypothetical protein
MNDINELRTALFETLQAVKTGTMDVSRAKAVSDVAQTIINTAKVEIDYMAASGETVSSGFLGKPSGRPALVEVPAGQGVAAQLVNANIRQHKC